MGTVTMVLLVGLAVVLFGVVVQRLRTERYGRGEHRITLYSHKGRALSTNRSTSLRRVRSLRNRALSSRRIGSVELLYANGQRELPFKLHQAER
jgi:hypothetical protein